MGGYASKRVVKTFGLQCQAGRGLAKNGRKRNPKQGVASANIWIFFNYNIISLPPIICPAPFTETERFSLWSLVDEACSVTLCLCFGFFMKTNARNSNVFWSRELH